MELRFERIFDLIRRVDGGLGWRQYASRRKFELPVELGRLTLCEAAKADQRHPTSLAVSPETRPNRCTSFFLNTQRLEAGDNVEQFLVDPTLAQTMECPVEVLQQFIDVLIGTLHRRQSTCVFAR